MHNLNVLKVECFKENLICLISNKVPVISSFIKKCLFKKKKKKKKECILRACLFLVCTLRLKSQPSLRGKQLQEQYICGIIHSFPC